MSRPYPRDQAAPSPAARRVNPPAARYPRTVPRSHRLAFTLRALAHRNYRLFFGGQGVSLIGTWITRVATSWLVYRLTGSARVLGLVGFAGQIPTFLLAPFAGVWVDRVNRYRVLLATQALAMLQSFALAALALAGVIRVWHVGVLLAFQGVINAFDTPARQALVVDMVEEREDLPNAIALNSSMVNGARLIGPSVAGVLIAAAGEGWCFLVDAISYLAVLGSLLAMRLPAPVPRARATRALDDLRAGFRYAFGFPPIRALLLLLAVVSLVGMPYTVLMPMVAAETLHGGPRTLGALMAASGVGALTGALFLAGRSTVVGLGRVIVWAAAAFGAGLVGFALSRTVVIAVPMMVVTGFGFMTQLAASNTVLQTIVRDEMRGRVMAFYAMAFVGTAPFGSLLAGLVAARIGAPATILGGGVACVLAAAVFARGLPTLRERVRPIYERQGILLAEGIGAASGLRDESGS